MIQKKITAACLLLAMCFMFSGCGKKSPLDPKNPVTIEVWTYYNGADCI